MVHEGNSERLLRRQKVLADFGDFALQADDLDEVLSEACRLVSEALGTGRARILEIEPDGRTLFMRASVGWAGGVAGGLRVPLDERSSETYSIRAGVPVISQDIRKEQRFEIPQFMKEAGIVALANAPVFLPGGRAYGLLQVDDTGPREFDDHDTVFLRTYATILGPVIDRLFKMSALHASEERFRLTVEEAMDYAIFTVDDEGRITDWLPGAAATFGWTPEEAVGQPVAILFTPEDREAGEHHKEIDTARREGSAPDIRWHLRKDGSRVFINGTVRSLHAAKGVPRGFLKIGQDMTERRRTEDRLTAIFENASVGLSEVALDGRLLRVNDAFCRITGRAREALLDLGLDDVTHAEDRSPAFAAFRAVLEGDGSAGLDHRFVRPDGSVVWANSHATLLHCGDRDADALLVATVELTARRRAEQALRESEERFRAIVETARDYAIFMIDPEGLITAWTPGARHVFGWSEEEVLGQSMDITFTPEDREKDVPEAERATARAEGHARDCRWHLRKDGSRVFIDGVTRPLTGPGGVITGFVKVGQDVTERRATEAALRESEERFRQFGDASSDLLWIRDAETLDYEYLSPAFETIYGAPRDEALRGDQVFHWLEAIHPEDRSRMMDLLREVRAGKGVMETFRIIRRSDGEIRWIRNTDFPLFDANGRVQRIGGIAHDATEEVETRERLEVLVAELQHRTRNLIGVVRSIANQTMAHTGPTEAFREEFGHRLAALSRVQGLLSRVVQEPITIRALIELELDALGAGEGERVLLDGPAVRIRAANVQTLALAIHELATNARKYGALSEGGGRLVVAWHLLDDEQRLLIDWREEGLSLTDPTPSASGRDGGYGRRLIERALPHSLSAKTTYELEPTHLRCTIELPLT